MICTCQSPDYKQWTVLVDDHVIFLLLLALQSPPLSQPPRPLTIAAHCLADPLQ